MRKLQPGVFRELIRIDKHGNRHYKTNTCPRCGGEGKLGDILDAVRCTECNGTGKGKERTTIEYTPEQQQLRAEKATAKKLGTIEQQLKKLGFSEDGKGYRPLGNIFHVMDKIKKAGGVYQSHGFWIMPTKPDFIESEPVTFDVREQGGGVKYKVVSIDSYRAKNRI